MVEQLPFPAAHQAANPGAQCSSDIAGDPLFVALFPHQTDDPVVELVEHRSFNAGRRGCILQPALTGIKIYKRLLENDW